MQKTTELIESTMDNTSGGIDIFGSWFEVGMVGITILAGIVMSYPFLVQLLKKRLIKQQKNNFHWNIHTELHEKLTELRLKTDSGRTQVVLFHNGGEFLDGTSMKKLSLTHESLTKGVSSEIGLKKDIPISLCVDSMNLLKTDEPKIHIVELLSESYCKQFMQNSNTIAFAFLPLRGDFDTILGYIMCQWCSWNKADQINEDIVDELLIDGRGLVEVQLSQQLRKRKENVRVKGIHI